MSSKGFKSKQEIIFSLGLDSYFAEKLEYTQDVLNDSFSQATIKQPDDYEGTVTCTLVKKNNIESKVGVLYIHGFSDYFFQTEMADNFSDRGFAFYALDLRKYGRSHLQNQKIFNVRDLSEYFADIDAALSIMHFEGVEKILLSGHSTGGLISTLYANQRIGRELFDALYCNSPFYDMNLNPILKKIILPLLVILGSRKPDRILKGGLSPWYGKSIHSTENGEWNFDLMWKPLLSPSVTYGWLKAIYNGQKQVQRGLKVSKPTLIMHSNNSVYPTKWSEDLHTGDAVLNVEDIAKYARKLEGNIEIQSIENGMHDLILSPKNVRESVYQKLFLWLNDNL